ncbi:glycosyltransferase family 2 protein [Actinomadura scrupuli]|uniref:glycosyltransferase family 2 protein n=1 Tax=Actinomadura scrupuli TaxID=559629 RepID=UPI003D991E97
MGPKVTVVVPVYNCRGTLGRALDSVFAQSLGMEHIEIVAVDDGSDDGSAEELDRLAGEHPQLIALHQANSGGPGGPRNAGIERATGEYVFFLDADDWLGTEALERMTAMADAHDTDVVVGKYVGVGRSVPERMFRRTVPVTTLAEPDPNVYATLSVLKLFRRSLLEDHRLRFPEGVLSGEDLIFAAHAYLQAKGISVLADYDCYYWVGREDGTSIMQNSGTPAETFFPYITEVFELVEAHTEPGQMRDRMFARHFEWDVLNWRFDEPYLGSDDDWPFSRAAAMRLIDRWLTPGTTELLPPHARLLVHCLRYDLLDELRKIIAAHRRGEPPVTVVDKGKAFAAYPYFRDPAVAIPDECYEITDRLTAGHRLTGLAWTDAGLTVRGHALIWRVGTQAQEVALVLRSKKHPGIEHRVPVERVATPDLAEGRYTYPEAGFTANITPAELRPPSQWDAYVEVAVEGLVREARLGAVRDEEVVAPGIRLAADGPYVTPYFTEYGNLTVGLGARGRREPVQVTEAAWVRRGRLRLTGRLLDAGPGSGEFAFRAELRRRGTDDTRLSSAEVDAGGGFTVELDLRGAAGGRWDLWGQISAGSATARIRVAALDRPPGRSSCSATRLAEPYETKDGDLSLRVGDRRVVRVLKRLRGSVRNPRS